MHINEKINLLVRYFISKDFARKPHYHFQIANEVGFPYEDSKVILQQILRTIKSEEIHEIINKTFLKLAKDEYEINSNFFIHDARELIRLKSYQEQQKVKERAFIFTIFCCLPIITIPFAYFINKLLMNLLSKNRSLHMIHLNDEQRKEYESAKENKRYKPSKKTCFNHKGELRKFAMPTDGRWTYFASKEQAGRLQFKLQSLVLTQALTRHFSKKNFSTLQKTEQEKIYKAYKIVCQFKDIKPINKKDFLKTSPQAIKKDIFRRRNDSLEESEREIKVELVKS